MKKIILFAAALALTGCSSFSLDVATRDDFRKAAAVAIATYADVYQPAVLAYGSLPPCPAALLCREPEVHAKMKALDLAAVRSIDAAEAVLTGNAASRGEVERAIAAVVEAEIAIASAAGRFVKKEK